MARYDGKFGEKACADCSTRESPVRATQYLGKRLSTPTGRTHLYTCANCANNRGVNVNDDIGASETPQPKEPPKELPQPTRVDTFMSGHDNARYYQASLFDE